MKKISASHLILILILTPCFLRAQKPSLAVGSQFPDAVTASVYEITSILNLPADKQWALARHFQLEDSMVAAAARFGATQSEISNIRLKMHHAFQSLLTPEQLKYYYTKKLGDNAKRIAWLMADQAKRRYDCDSTTTRSLYNAYFSRQINIDRVLQQYEGDPDLTEQLNGIIEQYDSITDKYLYKASSTHFLQEQVSLLNRIKPLSEKDQSALRNSFLNLCYKRNDKSFLDNYYQVFKSLIYDTVYYAGLFSQEIEQEASINERKEAQKILQKGKLSKEEVDMVLRVLYQKHRALAVYNQAMPIFNSQKDTMLSRATVYYDSIIAYILEKYDPALPPSQFSDALKYSRQLTLSQNQVESLQSNAIRAKQLAKISEKDGAETKFNLPVFESEQIPLILTDAQYTQLLTLENSGKALEWAKGDWAEMKQRGITEGYDSVVVVNQIFNYDLSRLIAKSRFQNDRVRLNEITQELKTNTPEPLRKLIAARNGSPIGNTSIQGKLSW